MHKSNCIRFCRVMMAGILLSSAGACSVFTPVEVPQVTEYQLSPFAATDAGSCTAAANKSGDILQVTEVQADAPFNNRKMYYSESASQINSYALNEWVAHPNVMLTQAMQEKLISSCIYANVVNAELMTTAKYRLTSQLLNFKQVISGQTSTMQLSILVQLIDNASNKVIRSKNFTDQAEVTPTPLGYVNGANIVTAAFLTELETWLSSASAAG